MVAVLYIELYKLHQVQVRTLLCCCRQRLLTAENTCMANLACQGHWDRHGQSGGFTSWPECSKVHMPWTCPKMRPLCWAWQFDDLYRENGQHVCCSCMTLQKTTTTEGQGLLQVHTAAQLSDAQPAP